MMMMEDDMIIYKDKNVQLDCNNLFFEGVMSSDILGLCRDVYIISFFTTLYGRVILVNIC